MIEHLIESGTSKAMHDLYGATVDEKLIQIQKTRPEFDWEGTLLIICLK